MSQHHGRGRSPLSRRLGSTRKAKVSRRSAGMAGIFARGLNVERLEDRRMLAAGSLDPTFDPPPIGPLPGVVVSDLGFFEEGQALAVQSDGKILMVGTLDDLDNPSPSDIAVARYNANGTLDLDFGNGGLATINFQSSAGVDLNDLGRDIAIDSNGRIVVVGWVQTLGGIGVARLTADGDLDTSFGDGGKTLTTIAEFTVEPRGMALDASGRIIVAGRRLLTSDLTQQQQDFIVARYLAEDSDDLPAGSLDPTFNVVGYAITDFGGRDEAFDVAIQSNDDETAADDKIVAVGVAGADRQFALARYNIDGSLDTTFGSGGTRLTDIVGAGGFETIDSVAIQQNDKIVVTGTTALGDVAVARYLADGSALDLGFNAGNPQQPGVNLINIGDSDTAEGVVIQPDGAIVAAGHFQSSGNRKVFVLRLTTGGVLDLTFGSGGITTTDTSAASGTNEFFRDVALSPDGKIVAGGRDRSRDFLLARYESGLIVATADAGGPYVLFEPGASVPLAGSGSGTVISYAWDLDGDNNFGEASTANGDETLQNPIFTATNVDGPTTLTLKLRVWSDTNGDSIADQVANDTASVTVNNVAPTLTISGAADVNEGSAYTLTLSGNDPGNDTITHWIVNWGDGSPEQTVNAGPRVFDAETQRWQTTVSQMHTYADGSASYTISAAATDEDGTFTSNSHAVMVNNVAPTLTISGASEVDEGSAYILNLWKSDPGADTITSWTINWGDESPVQTVSGSATSVTHTYADGVAEYTISATATDEDGTSSSNSVEITVDNVAPNITSLSTSSPNFGGAKEGDQVTLSATFSDPGTADTHTATIAWGDGTISTTNVNQGANPDFASHTYADGGFYTVTLTLKDDDNGQDIEKTTAVIAGVGLHGGVLQVVGTNGCDQVTIFKLFGHIKVLYHLDGGPIALEAFSESTVNEIEVYLGGGNDIALVSSSVAKPATMFGGDGNDLLTGGAGNDVLVGGAGNDVLWGGNGRDLMIGGDGADAIHGGSGEDIMIAGSTSFDGGDLDDRASLAKIMAEWTSTRTYEERRNNLINVDPSIVRLNGDVFLIADGPGATVFDDDDVDLLWGGTGRDMFFASLDGASQDWLADDANGEFVAAMAE